MPHAVLQDSHPHHGQRGATRSLAQRKSSLLITFCAAALSFSSAMALRNPSSLESSPPARRPTESGLQRWEEREGWRLWHSIKRRGGAAVLFEGGACLKGASLSYPSLINTPLYLRGAGYSSSGTEGDEEEQGGQEGEEAGEENRLGILREEHGKGGAGGGLRALQQRGGVELGQHERHGGEGRGGQEGGGERGGGGEGGWKSFGMLSDLVAMRESAAWSRNVRRLHPLLASVMRMRYAVSGTNQGFAASRIPMRLRGGALWAR
eukprot:447846-Rhodomonas_salina.2